MFATLDRDLIKHAGEFRRSLSNLKFERTEDGGIYFPAAHAIARGMYAHDVNGLDERFDPNILPTEGLNYLLDIGLGAGSQLTAWYLGLFSGAVTPTSTLTAANWTSTLTEITSGSEGYSESTRVAWTPASASGGSATNTASKAAFTIITASNVTVEGAVMASASAKGATTGKVASASRFSTPRTLSDGDSFNVGYTVTLTSS